MNVVCIIHVFYFYVIFSYIFLCCTVRMAVNKSRLQSELRLMMEIKPIQTWSVGAKTDKGLLSSQPVYQSSNLRCFILNSPETITILHTVRRELCCERFLKKRWRNIRERRIIIKIEDSKCVIISLSKRNKTQFLTEVQTYVLIYIIFLLLWRREQRLGHRGWDQTPYPFTPPPPQHALIGQVSTCERTDGQKDCTRQLCPATDG